MIDSWSNESLTCFAILEQSAPLVVGQSAYTIGPGGNFNMTRPIRVNFEAGSAYIKDTNGNNYLMEVVTRLKWNMIGNRSSPTSNVPDTFFYDPQFPLGIINVFPVPNISWTMYWDSYLQLSEFAQLNTVAQFPPGYMLALKSNLAVFMKPYFSSAQLDPDVRQQAVDSKATIKRANNRPNVSNYDSEIVSRAPGSYNIYSDRQNGTSG